VRPEGGFQDNVMIGPGPGSHAMPMLPPPPGGEVGMISILDEPA
jgi:hypothetical protein